MRGYLSESQRAGVKNRSGRHRIITTADRTDFDDSLAQVQEVLACILASFHYMVYASFCVSPDKMVVIRVVLYTGPGFNSVIIEVLPPDWAAVVYQVSTPTLLIDAN